MRYIILYILLLQQAFGFDYQLQSTKINDHIECFFGLEEKIYASNGANILNSCFIETTEGYVVIDSGPTYSYAQQVYEILQKRKRLPVKYLINTSSQEVNVLGNEFYKEQGAILIGPDSYRELLGDSYTIQLSKRVTRDTFLNTRTVPLDIYVNKSKKITLGETTIEIKSFEQSMSQNLLLYIGRESMLFAGNYLNNNSQQNLQVMESLESWIDGVKEIERVGVEYIVASHGKRRDQEALHNTKRYLAQHQPTPKNNALSESEKTLLATLSSIQTSKELSEEENRAYQRAERAKAEKLRVEKLKIEKARVRMAKLRKREKEKRERAQKIKKRQALAKAMMKSLKRAKEIERKKIPNVQYSNLKTAKKEAITQHKYLLIKVESEGCLPCQKLDELLASNQHIKEMMYRYIKAVKVDSHKSPTPLGLSVKGTPTVFLIKPENNKVVAILEGRSAIEELEDTLVLFTREKNNQIVLNY